MNMHQLHLIQVARLRIYFGKKLLYLLILLTLRCVQSRLRKQRKSCDFTAAANSNEGRPLVAERTDDDDDDDDDESISNAASTQDSRVKVA